MPEITYLKGDATLPQASGVKIIAQVNNDIGKWGKGFVMAVSRRWPQTREQYLRWYNNRAKNDFELGAVQFLQVEKYTWLANMVGQHGIKTGSKGPPIRYEAVEKCLEKVAQKAIQLKASVHMPRIGSGLAGGNFKVIEEIITKTLCDKGVEVYVYDFNG